MAVDYASLLSVPLDQIKRPPAKPAGTYIGVIESYKFDVSRQKKTPFVSFTISQLTPGPDVDQTLLEGIDLSKWKPSKDFYLTEDALWRLKEFIESFPDIDSTGRQLNEILPELKGQMVQLEITQKPSDDGEFMRNEYGNMTAATND